jgi:putative NIF3 family GTP cyclohydrolase 1 type 2
MLNAVHKLSSLFFLALLFHANVAPAQTKPTARQIVERIQKNVAVPWRTETVDTFKAGNPDTPVTGIATTFSATLDVLQRAVASGKNFIIAHEPTFYNHLDTTKDIEGDAVLAAKQSYIEKHGLVVFRFHDHWHARRPDGILTGMTETLGWDKYRSPDRPNLFIFPGTSLEGLAKDIKDRLHIRTMRVIGDPTLKLTHVAFIPGAAGSIAQIRTLERDDVEALVIGETREWETVEYVRDAITEGKKKALVIMGHVPSEENGMQKCARWLKTFVPEVPIEFIPAGEPFWTPK